MIIDCDTHIIPRDAFDYVEDDLKPLRPIFHFDEKGHYTHCTFPGKPQEIPGSTPHLGFNATGINYDGMCDIERDSEIIKRSASSYRSWRPSSWAGGLISSSRGSPRRWPTLTIWLS